MKTCYALLTLVTLFASSALAEVRIGWIGPLTGPAAILGVDAVPAIELAVEEHNRNSEQKIRLLIEDDQYETAKAVAAYHRLVHTENVRILFVFTYGAVFSLAEKAAVDGVLIVDTLDCDEKIAALPKNVICIAKKTEALGVEIANAIVNQKDLPTAMLYFNSDPFMGVLGEAAEGRLREQGASLVLSEGYPAGTTDFRSFLTKARVRGVKSLILLGYDEIGSAMRQARSLGFKGQFYSTPVAQSPSFQEAAGGNVAGTIVPAYFAPRTEEYNKFIERFRSKTGRDVNFEVSTFPSYDTATLIARAVANTTTSDQSELSKLVTAELYKTADYQGLSGVVTVDQDGATRSLETTVGRLGNEGLEPLR